MFNKMSIVVYIIVSVAFIGCGEGGLISLDEADEYSIAPPEGFTAQDFPSANGTKWSYSSDEYSFDLMVNGTYLVRAQTARVLDCSSDKPVDYLSASGRYLTIDGNFVNFPLNVKRTYFRKEISGYYEVGFDMELPEYGISYLHRVHHPERLIWKFPIRVGDEWTVLNKDTFPEFKVIRRVVSYGDLVDVPGSEKRKAYRVEEFSASYGEDIPETPVATYWLVPGVGVARYEYLDEFSGETVSYKLTDLFIPPKSR